jgi:hypothetical protein
VGEVAPLGDGEGRKNIKFYSFLRAIRESPLQLMVLVRILGERTYFVGVGAHDDPKNNQLLQYKRRAHNVRKTFLLEVF